MTRQEQLQARFESKLSELNEANKLEKSYDNVQLLTILADELRLISESLLSFTPKQISTKFNPYEVFVPKGRYTGD